MYIIIIMIFIIITVIAITIIVNVKYIIFVVYQIWIEINNMALIVITNGTVVPRYDPSTFIPYSCRLFGIPKNWEIKAVNRPS